MNQDEEITKLKAITKDLVAELKAATCRMKAEE